MKQTITLGKYTFRIDTGFILMLVLMGLTSFFALYNAFNLISDGSGYGYMFRQIMWYGIGFTAMFILCSFPNEAIYSIMKKAPERDAVQKIGQRPARFFHCWKREGVLRVKSPDNFGKNM